MTSDSGPAQDGRRTEAWTAVPCWPKVAAREAVRAEAEGWDGLVLPDSQNLAADVLVELALCAAATHTIHLSTGVTNPVTRHPAVLAGAMATIQAESGGRAVLGIGRGDSALAHIGHAPASVAHLERYVRSVQGYLRGETIPFDDRFAPVGLAGVAALGLAGGPDGSALTWLRPTQPKVPLDIVATGPRVIAMGAQLSERTTLTVGAAPERVAWGIDRFLDARRSAGLDERLDGVGVYVNLAVHPDPVVARRLVRGVLATFSRFSVMHGDVTGGAQGDDAATLDALHQAYDMNAHATTHASHQAALPDDFVDRMAVVGTPEHCLDRLSALRKLGVTRFIVMQLPRHDPESAVARELLVREVLPVVRSW